MKPSSGGMVLFVASMVAFFVFDYGSIQWAVYKICAAIFAVGVMICLAIEGK